MPVISDILLFLIFPFFIIRKSHVVEPKSITIMSENKEDIYNAVAYQLNEPIFLNEALLIFNEFWKPFLVKIYDTHLLCIICLTI